MGEEDRIQRSGFLFCFGKNEKDGELFAKFFDGNEKETTLDEKKNTLIMRRLALKLDLYYAFIRYWDGKGRIPVVFVYFFFFVLRWTWERIFGMGEL